MSTVTTPIIGMVFSFLLLAGSHAQADVVTYSLENIILDENNAQMSGEFSWTYDVGDFENGVGQFSYLDIPFTPHDQTDLITTIDVGSSIEITLEGNMHDDGVDITLVLMQPLSPTSGSSMDLSQSHYDIGGNGFHAGVFLSGSIQLATPSAVEDQPASLMTVNTLAAYPNPFNPRTRLEFELGSESVVRLEIFDVRGRSVRVLREGVYASGVHSVNWDGTDGFGRSVPSGHYFGSLQAGGEVVFRGMMLVR